MSNEGSSLFLASVVQSIFYLSWRVVLTHLSERELPILLALCIKSSMSGGVGCSSLVSKPHIEALSNQLKSWCMDDVMHDPAIGRIQNTVLQKHDRSIIRSIACSNSEQVELVSIFGDNRVLLKDEPIFIDNLLKRLAHVRIGMENQVAK